MNQHPVNLRLPLLLEDIKIKSLTDRPCAHTDLLIEKALKDEKFKKTLDDSDWSSIGILQNEIKQASNVLKDMDWKRKKASSYNPEIVKIPDNMTKLQKLEKELREKNKIINDLKKRNNELEKIAVELNCDKDELTKINSKLTTELNVAISECEKISRVLNKDEKNLPEIFKYTNFLLKKLKEMPDFRSLFEDRIAPANFMSLVMSKNFDTSLLASLQILSDVIVHLIPSTNLEEFQGAIPYTNKNEEISITITSDESSLIFQQIDAQSQRMAKLNQEISIAMNKIH